MIGIIRDGVFHLQNISNDSDFPEKKKLKLLEIFSLAYSCLRSFCYENHINQRILAAQFELFLSNLNIEMNQIPLICEMIRENRLNCETYGATIIKRIMKAITTHGRKANFLEPLIVTLIKYYY